VGFVLIAACGSSHPNATLIANHHVLDACERAGDHLVTLERAEGVTPSQIDEPSLLRSCASWPAEVVACATDATGESLEACRSVDGIVPVSLRLVVLEIKVARLKAQITRSSRSLLLDESVAETANN